MGVILAAIFTVLLLMEVCDLGFYSLALGGLVMSPLSVHSLIRVASSEVDEKFSEKGVIRNEAFINHALFSVEQKKSPHVRSTAQESFLVVGVF